MKDEHRCLFEKVKTHMGWNDHKTALWFRTENPLLGGVTPQFMLNTGREARIERWIDSIIDENTPAPKEKSE